MKDLLNPRWMYLKAVLFLVIGFTSVALLFAAVPSIQTSILLTLIIWSFCRVYYFMFYVIENYIDPKFKFAGLISAFAYVCGRR